jgi:hypothetical protein
MGPGHDQEAVEQFVAGAHDEAFRTGDARPFELGAPTHRPPGAGFRATVDRRLAGWITGWVASNRKQGHPLSPAAVFGLAHEAHEAANIGAVGVVDPILKIPVARGPPGLAVGLRHRSVSRLISHRPPIFSISMRLREMMSRPSDW